MITDISCLFPDGDFIDFGDLPATINALLQQGVAAYRTDVAAADRLFREALAMRPDLLPTYFCLYKIHTYRGNLEFAEEAAGAGLREAATQAGWPAAWRDWGPQMEMPDGPSRFALYTLKALAFIRLRQNNLSLATEILDQLRKLDPLGQVGWPVVAALAASLADDEV